MTTETRFVYYSASRRSIVALQNPNTAGSSSGKTLAQLVAQYGPLEIMPLAMAVKSIQACHITTPAEIDADNFFEMLAVLSPDKWTHSAGAETFQLIDNASGNVTLTLCRIGANFFYWYDIAGTTHDELVAKAAQFIELGSPAVSQ